MPPSARALLCAVAVLGACGESASGDSAAGPTPTDDTGNVPRPDTAVADDAAPPGGPPCTTPLDCAVAFVDLGACERADCVVPAGATAGVCVRASRAEGDACVSDDACALSAVCTAQGECLPDVWVSCAARPCEESLGCVDGACTYAPADGQACDDGDPCTAGEQCSAGACGGGAPVAGCSCVRDSDCAAPDDACAGAPACVEGRCALVPPGGVVCDATADACRASVCADGACVTTALDGGDCSDGNLCTLGDACVAGACVGAPGPGCACEADADCAGFDDTDRCNGVVACIQGTCAVDPESIVVCAAPNEPCHKAVCEPATGLCVETYRADGVPCDDGDACTLGDRCVQGACAPATPATCGPPATCDGGACDTACLASLVCDSATGCPDDVAWRLSGTACDDGDPCRLSDVCAAGRCVAGAIAVDCGASSACAVAACVPGVGCALTPVDGPCDDGDPCTAGDHCEGGECAAGGPLDCEDDDPCTTGYCAPGVGCTLVNNTAACDDGDACTAGDRCQAGQCKPGPKTCPCNEDSDCTGGATGTCLGRWHCVASQCVLDIGAATPCTGGGPCATSTCQFASGACATVASSDGAPCDDGSACVASDRWGLRGDAGRVR